MKQYFIVDLDDGEFVLWSNDFGWTTSTLEATIFTYEERETLNLPAGNDPGWCLISGETT